jgi:hypothetical protein
MRKRTRRWRRVAITREIRLMEILSVGVKVLELVRPIVNVKLSTNPTFANVTIRTKPTFEIVVLGTKSTYAIFALSTKPTYQQWAVVKECIFNIVKHYRKAVIFPTL